MPARLLTTLVLTGLLAACSSADYHGVATIDLNQVASALERDVLIQQNVQTANANLNQQLEQLSQNLRAELEQERTRLGAQPSQAEEEAYVMRVQSANLQLNQSRQLALQKSQEIQDMYLREFRAEVSQFARELAYERGLTAVFVVNDDLLWSDTAVDITPEVTAAMRDNTRPSTANQADGSSAATTTEP